MESINYRAIALLCPQQAPLGPEANWQWLSDAERDEHLADAEIAVHFEEWNGNIEFGAKSAVPDRSLADFLSASRMMLRLRRIATNPPRVIVDLHFCAR